MAENNEPFREEYNRGTKTDSEQCSIGTETQATPSASDFIPDIDNEVKVYGIAKPRRVIIRAKITHDQD